MKEVEISGQTLSIELGLYFLKILSKVELAETLVNIKNIGGKNHFLARRDSFSVI